MHIGFAALNVVMQVIPEKLNVGNRSCSDVWGFEVARGQDEGDVTDVLRRPHIRQMPDLQRGEFRRV